MANSLTVAVASLAMSALAASDQNPPPAVDKYEKFHTAIDIEPLLELKTEQWPFYDSLVYKEIVWDREYYFHLGLTMSFTLEFAHMAYYKLSGTFSLLKAGFGVQDIVFEHSPTMCSLFYSDARLFAASVALESNTKSCSHNFLSHLGMHYDSRDASQSTEPVEEQDQADNAPKTRALKQESPEKNSVENKVDSEQ